MPIIEVTHSAPQAEIWAVYGADGLSIDAVSVKIPELLSYGSVRTSGFSISSYRSTDHRRSTLASLHSRRPRIRSVPASDLSKGAVLLNAPTLGFSGFLTGKQSGILYAPGADLSLYWSSDHAAERMQAGSWFAAEHPSGLSVSAKLLLEAGRFERPALFTKRTLLFEHDYFSLGTIDAATHKHLSESMKFRTERSVFAQINPADSIRCILGRSEFSADYPKTLHRNTTSSQLYAEGEHLKIQLFRSSTREVTQQMRSDDAYRWEYGFSYTRGPGTVTCDHTAYGELENLEFKQKLTFTFELSRIEAGIQLQRTGIHGEIEVSGSVIWQIGSWCNLTVETDFQSTQLVFTYKSSSKRAVSK
jgi:hypothetical protein